MFTMLFVLILGAVGFALAKFPVDPLPCKFGNEECLVARMNHFLSEHYNGDDSIDLIKTDPLVVNEINIKQGANSPVNIDLKFTNNEIFGLKHGKAIKVKGFEKDMTRKSGIHFKVPIVTLLGDYSITGKVMILPVNGNGRSNMTMLNADFFTLFNGEPYEKDGATYMNITNMKLRIQPERLFYQFDNLFNGDKALGDNMNLFLNDNWKEIFDEVKESMQSVLGHIFEQIVNNVFSKYPYEKYFATEEADKKNN